MVPLSSTETASGILLQAEVGEAGTAPGRMGPWARPVSSPDQMDTESIAMTRVNNGKSVEGEKDNELMINHSKFAVILSTPATGLPAMMTRSSSGT